MKQRAILLDRDGTLVYPRHYPSRPADLSIYEGITPHLRKLQSAGFRLVVITNQAGIARGYLTETDLKEMHEYLRSELAKEGVRLDAIYYCPHHIEGVVKEFARSCACRKPRPGMLLQAASDLNLDLRHSWFVGDILDDVEAGNRAGCRTVLVDLGTESLPDQSVRTPHFVARCTRHALCIIEAVESLSQAADLAYRPVTWRGAADLAGCSSTGGVKHE